MENVALLGAAFFLFNFKKSVKILDSSCLFASLYLYLYMIKNEGYSFNKLLNINIMNNLLSNAIIEVVKENVHETITLNNDISSKIKNGRMSLSDDVIKNNQLEDYELLFFIDNTEGNQQDLSEVAVGIINNMPNECNIVEVIVEFENSIFGSPQNICFYLVENCD